MYNHFVNQYFFFKQNHVKLTYLNSFSFVKKIHFYKYNYYERNHLSFISGVWGTDVEIFGAAILLKTSIYVYMTATGEWQLFKKDITIKKQVSKTEKCLYIRNLNNVLYDVVINVE